MIKYLFHCEDWGHCEQEVFDTLEEAVMYADHEWRYLTYNEQKKFIKFCDSWAFRIYKLEISKEDFEKYEDGELDTYILEYVIDTARDYGAYHKEVTKFVVELDDGNEFIEEVADNSYDADVIAERLWNGLPETDRTHYLKALADDCDSWILHIYKIDIKQGELDEWFKGSSDIRLWDYTNDMEWWTPDKQ